MRNLLNASIPDFTLTHDLMVLRALRNQVELREVLQEHCT